MKQLKSALLMLFAVIVFVGLAMVVFNNYGYIFSKRISGEIIGVEKLNQGTAIVGSGAISPEALFSFAVAIKAKSGEIFTSSSQDRQWAVATKGMCVEALFYPYPFWDMEKDGTYNNARLIKLFECPGGSRGSGATPAPQATP
jgi:hypothetical protein